MQWTRILLIGLAGLGLSVPAAFGQAAPNRTQLPQVQQQGPQSGLPFGKMTSYLGVGLQDVTSQRAKELKLPEEAGVEITQVEANSPAQTAGLKAGDVVLQYNGQRVEGIEQFTRLVQETPAGREVKLQISRDGNSQTVTAKIGSHQAPPPPWLPGQQLVFPTQPPGGANSGTWQLPRPLAPRQGNSSSAGAGELGIQAILVEGQLADYFGVKQGVLVASVSAGSPAEKAGLKAGDVITRAGDARVATPADISMQIRSAKGKSLALTITRDHKEMTVNAPMDEPF